MKTPKTLKRLVNTIRADSSRRKFRKEQHQTKIAACSANEPQRKKLSNVFTKTSSSRNKSSSTKQEWADSKVPNFRKRTQNHPRIERNHTDDIRSHPKHPKYINIDIESHRGTSSAKRPARRNGLTRIRPRRHSKKVTTQKLLQHMKENEAKECDENEKSINNDSDNNGAKRSRSQGHRSSGAGASDKTIDEYRQDPNQHASSNTRRNSAKKDSKKSRRSDLDKTTRELFHPSRKNYKQNASGGNNNNKNNSNRKRREQRSIQQRKTRSRSLKEADRNKIRIKSKNSRSNSLPTVRQPNDNNHFETSSLLERKSPFRPRKMDKSSHNARKTTTTMEGSAPCLPLKNNPNDRQIKEQPVAVVEPLETSQTDRTSRTEYTTSSAGPIEPSSHEQSFRSRSVPRRPATRARSCSRIPPKNRTRSVSHKRRSTNSAMMSVEDAKKLLHPTNHPTYVIQQVIYSSSEDEVDLQRGEYKVQQSPRRRRRPKRDGSKNKSRKERRPVRKSAEAKMMTEPRASPSNFYPVTLSTRSSRYFQRSHCRECQCFEKNISSDVSQPKRYPNPFVKVA